MIRKLVFLLLISQILALNNHAQQANIKEFSPEGTQW